MSRDSNAPRHARVCQHPAGRRLQHAALPVALGGLVAGSVWLAADASAAPATHGPGPSDTSVQADAMPAHDGGSYAAWRDADGRNSPGVPDSRDTYGQRDDRVHHDQHYYDWREHTGEHRYADRSRVLVRRTAAQPHHATATSAAAMQARAATRPQQQAQQVAAAAPAQGQPAAHPPRRLRPADLPPSGTAASSTRPGTVRHLSRAARGSLAASDTARPASDYVAVYGAIGGAALAALLGTGGVAVWRRRGTGEV